MTSEDKDLLNPLIRLVAVKKETSRNRMMPEASKRVAGG